MSSSVSPLKISDLDTRQIAQINSLALKSQQTNPYLLHRLFHATPKLPKSDKLFAFQSSRFLQDSYTIDLLSQKTSGVLNSTSAHLTQEGASPVSPLVAPVSTLFAAAQVQSQVSKTAAKTLLPVLEKRPRDAGLLLTIVHLYLLTNNHNSAVTLFESFFKRLEHAGTAVDLDVRYAPGVIAVAVALYETQGRNAQAKQELAKAAKYWRNREKEDGAYSTELLRTAGVALLEEQKQEAVTDAAQIFESLLAEFPNDEATKVGLIAAYAKASPDKLQKEQISSLPTAQQLIPGLSKLADTLEASGVPSAAQPVASATTSKRKTAAQQPAAKKKIRASRVPKNFVEGKEPDKERWLPLRDRSNYRPKKRKGKSDGGGLTQGGPVADDKGTGSGAENRAGTVIGGSGGQNKKKKAKGKAGKR